MTKQNTSKSGRIFLRNLAFKNMNEEKLKALFEKYGEITEVSLPKKESGEMKGFGFIQFTNKEDALKAISEMNNYKLEGRKIQVNLAVNKDEYQSEGRNEQVTDDKNKFKTNNANNDKDKVKGKGITTTNEAKDVIKEDKPKYDKPLLNDPHRTIFCRNLGFVTDEESLKTFFNTLQGNVIYAKIVKDHQTKVSKGTGFVMFKSKEDVESILALYYKYNNRNKANEADDFESSSLNPFELDGRNLKLFRALAKDDATKMETEAEIRKNEDKRNRPLLYYGLSQSTIKYFLEENQLVPDEEIMRRESMIKMKKTNFTKNPNYHVSETRVQIKNLDASTNEEKLRTVLKEIIEKYEKTLTAEQKKKYNRMKKIKQIKLLKDKNETDKDGNQRSKCVAFVEVCDLDLAKHLINTLSNAKLNKNSRRGLILDFALEDARKINERTKKMERIKESIKNKKEQEKENNEVEGVVTAKSIEKSPVEKKEKKVKKETTEVVNVNEAENTITTTPTPFNTDLIIKKEKVKPKDNINEINDIQKLKEIYVNCFSRGKKQRIKKKLRSLGFTEPVESLNKKNILNDNPTYSKKVQEFTATKIETVKTNLNKKIVEENRKNKNDKKDKFNKSDKNKNIKNKIDNKFNKNKGENKLNKSEGVVAKTTKVTTKTTDSEPKEVKMLNNKRSRDSKDKKVATKTKKQETSNNFSDDDGDDDMNPYYAQIMANLKKTQK